jgi:hypothetical protein
MTHAGRTTLLPGPYTFEGNAMVGNLSKTSNSEVYVHTFLINEIYCTSEMVVLGHLLCAS